MSCNSDIINVFTTTRNSEHPLSRVATLKFSVKYWPAFVRFGQIQPLLVKPNFRVGIFHAHLEQISEAIKPDRYLATSFICQTTRCSCALVFWTVWQLLGRLHSISLFLSPQFVSCAPENSVAHAQFAAPRPRLRTLLLCRCAVLLWAFSAAAQWKRNFRYSARGAQD